MTQTLNKTLLAILLSTYTSFESTQILAQEKTHKDKQKIISTQLPTIIKIGEIPRINSFNEGTDSIQYKTLDRFVSLNKDTLIAGDNYGMAQLVEKETHGKRVIQEGYTTRLEHFYNGMDITNPLDILFGTYHTMVYNYQAKLDKVGVEIDINKINITYSDDGKFSKEITYVTDKKEEALLKKLGVISSGKATYNVKGVKKGHVADDNHILLPPKDGVILYLLPQGPIATEIPSEIPEQITKEPEKQPAQEPEKHPTQYPEKQPKITKKSAFSLERANTILAAEWTDRNVKSPYMDVSAVSTHPAILGDFAARYRLSDGFNLTAGLEGRISFPGGDYTSKGKNIGVFKGHDAELLVNLGIMAKTSSSTAASVFIPYRLENSKFDINYQGAANNVSSSTMINATGVGIKIQMPIAGSKLEIGASREILGERIQEDKSDDGAYEKSVSDVKGTTVFAKLSGYLGKIWNTSIRGRLSGEYRTENFTAQKGFTQDVQRDMLGIKADLYLGDHLSLNAGYAQYKEDTERLKMDSNLLRTFAGIGYRF